MNGRENRLMTIDEVAGVLHVSHLSVYRLIKRGRLRALRVGKDFRVRSSDMTQYIAKTPGRGPFPY